MEIKIGEEGRGTIILDGEVTVQRAGELKSSLLEALDKVTHLTVNLEKITEVDLSCLQLLCSAHSTFLKSNKALSLGENIPEVFLITVEKAGYSGKVPCCDNKNCLWIGGV